MNQCVDKTLTTLTEGRPLEGVNSLNDTHVFLVFCVPGSF